MYCAQCGAQNSIDAERCGRCGAALPAHCPGCGAELPKGARFCTVCGQSTKPVQPEGKPPNRQAHRLPTAGRRQVTVLFADLAGYTLLLHQSDAEDVRDYLTGLWEQLDRIIAEHGGLTEKHIGDAIMAVFGARQAREDDPIQAVRAGLAMQACLARVAHPPATPWKMRVGVHTGVVVVGPGGDSGEFIATGEAVNLACRLEQNAPVGGVLLSHDTYRQVYGLFDVRPMAPLEIGTTPEPIQTYLVLRARTRSLARTLRGVEGIETEMIGRQAELKKLQHILLEVMEYKKLRIITLVGEAGIGKSRLVREFTRWFESLSQAVRLFCGRASAEMMGLPFALMRDAFASRFEIQENDSAAAAREKLERGLLDLLRAGAGGAGLPGQDPVALVPVIGHLLGWDFSASPVLQEPLADAEQIRHRAFRYLSRFFATVSQGSADSTGAVPVSAALLVLEDIHWSDDGSLDLVDHLARTCVDSPLMIVCLARPTLFERRASWGGGLSAHTRLELEPLSRPESLALVDAILPRTSEVTRSLRDLIVREAEGIPFYIEEIIKMFIDQKVIVPGFPQARVPLDRAAVIRVPPTLQGVLQARLDGLTLPERVVLQRASVVGRVFWDRAVERLSDAPEGRSKPKVTHEGALSQDEVLEALAGLRRKELILRRESSAFAGAVEYSFKHELLRSVTYESLLKKLRRDHHATVAHWLIDTSGERINEFVGLVAAHFEQAGRPAEACDWYGRAGQQARASHSPATAIDSFRKALALLPAAQVHEGKYQTKRLEWHEGLGEVLGAQARFVEALEQFEQMRALAQGLNDRLAEARAWNGLAFLHERLGKNRASVDAAERAEVLARAAGDSGDVERVRALNLKGWACYRLNDAAAVFSLGEQTRQLCANSNDRQGLATSLKLHGVAHLQLGHYQEADQFFEQGLALYTELDDRRNAAAMLSNLGESARLRGNHQAAADLYRRALTLAKEIGQRSSEMIYLSNLAGARLGLGQFKEAEVELAQAIALTTTPHSCTLSETYAFLAESCLGQGKLAEAHQAAKHALALAKEAEIPLDQGTALRTLGRVAAGMQAQSASSGLHAPGPDPECCFQQSLSVFERIGAPGEQAHTLRAWAQFHLQNARGEQGQKLWDEARAIFQRLGMAGEVRRMDASGLAVEVRATA